MEDNTNQEVPQEHSLVVTKKSHTKILILTFLVIIILIAGSYYFFISNNNTVPIINTELTEALLEASPEEQSRIVLFTTTAHFVWWVGGVDETTSYRLFGTETEGVPLIRKTIEDIGLGYINLRYFMTANDFVIRVHHPDLSWSHCADRDLTMLVNNSTKGEDNHLTILRDTEYAQYPSSDIDLQTRCDGSPLQL